MPIGPEPRVKRGSVGDADDIAVLQRARRGQPDAVTALCTAWYPKVLRYMHYRVSPDMAEDLTAEVFVRVLRSLRNQQGSFPAWLFRIAENIVIDHRRSIAVRKQEPMHEQLKQHEDARRRPDEAVASRMDIENAMGQLSDDQRQLVTLKFLEGLGNEDIAQVMNRSVGAVRILQFRALEALRRILSGQEVAHES